MGLNESVAMNFLHKKTKIYAEKTTTWKKLLGGDDNLRPNRSKMENWRSVQGSGGGLARRG